MFRGGKCVWGIKNALFAPEKNMKEDEIKFQSGIRFSWSGSAGLWSIALMDGIDGGVVDTWTKFENLVSVGFMFFSL
jgi:hypothetical protein